MGGLVYIPETTSETKADEAPADLNLGPSALATEMPGWATERAGAPPGSTKPEPDPPSPNERPSRLSLRRIWSFRRSRTGGRSRKAKKKKQRKKRRRVFKWDKKRT